MRALLLTAAAALLLLWLFIPRPEEDTALRIEGRARRDLVEACNQAAADAGKVTRFSIDDVAPAQPEQTGTDGVVVAMASIMEARRDRLSCRWNGVEPATLAPVN